MSRPSQVRIFSLTMRPYNRKLSHITEKCPKRHPFRNDVIYIFVKMLDSIANYTVKIIAFRKMICLKKPNFSAPSSWKDTGCSCEPTWVTMSVRKKIIKFQKEVYLVAFLPYMFWTAVYTEKISFLVTHFHYITLPHSPLHIPPILSYHQLIHTQSQLRFFLRQLAVYPLSCWNKTCIF
jgi:hypothetical protein